MYSRTIKSCSLPYAWQQAVKYVRKSPQRIKFGGGTEIKHARDSQIQIILDNHGIEDALKHIVHPSDPFCIGKNGNPSEERINAYIKEYSKEYDASKFSYTYYDELSKFEVGRSYESGCSNSINFSYINLINKLRNGLEFQVKSNLPSNRNVVTLLNNAKWDMLSSMPCWNILWIRFEKIDDNGVAWVSIATWYRSHDLTDAWESNFIAQVTFIQKEILDPLNAKILYWHESNASLHIYEHNLDIANNIKTISLSPQLTQLQARYDYD